MNLQRLTITSVLLLAELASAYFLRRAVNFQNRVRRAIFAEDFATDLAVVSPEKKVELRVTLIASVCLVVWDPFFLVATDYFVITRFGVDSLANLVVDCGVGVDILAA